MSANRPPQQPRDLVNGLMEQMVIVASNGAYTGAQKYCLPLSKADLSTADCLACHRGPMLTPSYHTVFEMG